MLRDREFVTERPVNRGKKRFEEGRNWNVCLRECLSLSPSTWNVEIVIHTILCVCTDRPVLKNDFVFRGWMLEVEGV